MRSPRQNHLSNRHRHKVKSDKTAVTQVIASMVGNGVHDQLQRYLRDEARVNHNWMIERRLCTIVDGLRVSGRFDALYNQEDLYDIKVTKAYKAIKGDYDEWEQQLNAYDYMLYKDGITIKRLKIFMVVSDWNKGDSWQGAYPDTNINIIGINRWTRDLQEKWMKTRVNLWKSSLHLADDKLPLCTNEERWATTGIWKLYRTPKLLRASKTFPTKSRAEGYMNACKRKDPAKWGSAMIREDVGDHWKRCNWCDGAPFCNQYQQKIK